jgi:glycosyltransferase involved in cell wall biosynthesis
MIESEKKNDKPIRIVFFYAEVVGYVLGMFKALLSGDTPVIIDVVYRDQRQEDSSFFEAPELEGVRFHSRSKLCSAGLLSLLEECAPDIISVSGWVDKGYLHAIRRYRACGATAAVVCATDGQWHGTLRQHVGSIYFKLFYRQLFDFMWVAGKPQYSYAQRFGYDARNIICNLYSAEEKFFKKQAGVNRRFVFVGRFAHVKAIDELLLAYTRLPKERQEEWPLVLIGDGPLRSEIEKHKSKNIILKPFMQPSELMEELSHGGVACIASRSEPWGVAIHEMAAMGFPLVLSTLCGAATEYLIGGYNGYLFKSGDISSLTQSLLNITNLNEQELSDFSQRSQVLGSRVTPVCVASSLLSVRHLN